MPITLPTELVPATQDPGSREPLLWLWTVQLVEARDPDPSVVVDLVRNPEPITVGSTTFHPWPIQCSPIEHSATGDLPTAQLSIDNRTRWLMPYAHSFNGFAGQRVTGYLVNSAALPSALSGAARFFFEVRRAEANAEALVLQLEIPNLWRIRLPIDRYRPDRCDAPDFGGIECGYIRNDVAAYDTCGRTLGDCILRGADEAARRLPVRHPRRFGGFRGVAIHR